MRSIACIKKDDFLEFYTYLIENNFILSDLKYMLFKLYYSDISK